MPRVTQQKTRQALLVVGDPSDSNLLPEKLELFDEFGNALSIPFGHRRDLSFATAVLDAAADTRLVRTRKPGEGESGDIEINAGVMLTHIAVSQSARVRFYTSADKRDADVLRNRYTDPMDYPVKGMNTDHGCLSEFLLITTLEMDNIPADYLHSEDGGKDIYWRVDNFDLEDGAITVDITIKDVEQ